MTDGRSAAVAQRIEPRTPSAGSGGAHARSTPPGRPKAARRAAIGSDRGSDADVGGPRIGILVPRQSVRERLVLERPRGVDPSDPAIDLGVDAQRRAREVVVGGVGVDGRDRLAIRVSASRRRRSSTAAGSGRPRSASSISRRSRPRPGPGVASWRLEPVGRGRRSRRRWWRSDRTEARAIASRSAAASIPSCRAGPEPSPGPCRTRQRQPEPRRRRTRHRSVRSLHASATSIVSNACPPTVCAASASRHARDSILLVTGGHHDDRYQLHGAPSRSTRRHGRSPSSASWVRTPTSPSTGSVPGREGVVRHGARGVSGRSRRPRRRT